MSPIHIQHAVVCTYTADRLAKLARASIPQDLPALFVIGAHAIETLVRSCCVQMILHTGDMRWKAGMEKHPALQAVKVHTLILDTTYASPAHVHPPQVSLPSIVLLCMHVPDFCDQLVYFRHKHSIGLGGCRD